MVFDISSIAIILGIFFLAGIAKGIIGMGLPTISLALLILVSDLSTAMLLLLGPSIITNIWQGLRGPFIQPILMRLWPFLLSCGVAVPIGSLFLLKVDMNYLSALLGALLVGYALAEVLGFSLVISLKYEKLIGGILGSATGLLTGMTGSCVFPGVMFLQALKLDRNMMIQVMGLLFTISTVALAVGLYNNRVLNLENIFWSCVGIIPSLFGMMFGRKIRLRLSEKSFKKFFFFSLLGLGIYIIFQASIFL